MSHLSSPTAWVTETGFLSSFGACPGTPSVAQAGLKLTEIHLPLPPECGMKGVRHHQGTLGHFLRKAKIALPRLRYLRQFRLFTRGSSGVGEYGDRNDFTNLFVVHAEIHPLPIFQLILEEMPQSWADWLSESGYLLSSLMTGVQCPPNQKKIS